eukprot:362200-Chlamydomonas_euryale.AAC.11
MAYTACGAARHGGACACRAFFGNACVHFLRVWRCPALCTRGDARPHLYYEASHLSHPISTNPPRPADALPDHPHPIARSPSHLAHLRRLTSPHGRPLDNGPCVPLIATSARAVAPHSPAVSAPPRPRRSQQPNVPPYIARHSVRVRRP